jgi:hypothetical protein
MVTTPVQNTTGRDQGLRDMEAARKLYAITLGATSCDGRSEVHEGTLQLGKSVDIKCAAMVPSA